MLSKFPLLRIHEKMVVFFHNWLLMKLRHSRIKIPPLPWTESEPIIGVPTQQFRAGTPAISARVVCVSAIFANFYCDNWIIAPLSSSSSSSSSLSDPAPHLRLEKNELRAHATSIWLIIPFWSTSVLKISVFVVCKISVFVGLEKY